MELWMMRKPKESFKALNYQFNRNSEFQELEIGETQKVSKSENNAEKTQTEAAETEEEEVVETELDNDKQ